MPVRDFAAGEEAGQWHVAERAAHHLQLGRRRAEVRATAAGAADEDGPGDAWRGRRGVTGGARLRARQCFAGRRILRQSLCFELLADLGADARQVARGGVAMALAERELHALVDGVGDGHAALLRVYAYQMAHARVAAELAGPRQRLSAAVAQ